MDGQPKDIPLPRQDVIPYEKFFGQCFEARKLGNNQVIPVGGSSQFSDEVDIGFVGDFDHFKDLFEEMHQAIPLYNTEQLRNWIETQQIDIDPNLIATLEAFTRKLQDKHPPKPENASKRNELYAKFANPPKMSEVFETQAQECGEIAALAQGYLEREGLESSYFSGDVLWNRDHEFSEKHSFIVLNDRGKQIIFDPTNPTNTSGGYLPSIYTMNADFTSEVSKGQKRFVTATNILTKRNAYFGVNNGTNVSERNIV